MRCSYNLDQLGPGRYQVSRRLELRDSAEHILGATHEQRWRLQLRKMSGPQLRGLSRRVEWIRQQQKSINKTGARCGQEGRLAPSVRAATEEGTAGELMFHCRYSAAEPLLILFRSRR